MVEIEAWFSPTPLRQPWQPDKCFCGKQGPPFSVDAGWQRIRLRPMSKYSGQSRFTGAASKGQVRINRNWFSVLLVLRLLLGAWPARAEIGRASCRERV